MYRATYSDDRFGWVVVYEYSSIESRFVIGPFSQEKAIETAHLMQTIKDEHDIWSK